MTNGSEGEKMVVRLKSNCTSVNKIWFIRGKQLQKMKAEKAVTKYLLVEL